jgi:hypothetical protein
MSECESKDNDYIENVMSRRGLATTNATSLAKGRTRVVGFFIWTGISGDHPRSAAGV